jgi:uncharacterized membrane protein YbhN (UPF0104 family)
MRVRRQSIASSESLGDPGGSRRRLLRLAAVAGRIVGFGLVVFLVIRLAVLWRDHPIDFGHADIALLAASFVFTLAAVVLPGVVWIWILRWLGVEAPLRWVVLYFRAQMGKYLPGGVWQYAGRAALLNVRNVRLSTATLSLAIEFVAGAVAAGIVGAAVLEPWPLVAVGIAVAVVILGRRRLRGLLSRPFSVPGGARIRLTREQAAAAYRAGVRATFLYTPLWLLHGASVWLLARGLFGAPAADLWFYTGAFAVSWLAGLAAVFAPGGIGVREAVLAALLTPKIGAANAIVVAVASRMFFAAVDLLLGLAALSIREQSGPSASNLDARVTSSSEPT